MVSLDVESGSLNIYSLLICYFLWTHTLSLFLRASCLSQGGKHLCIHFKSLIKRQTRYQNYNGACLRPRCWLARPVSPAFKMDLLTLGSLWMPNPSSWQLICVETADGGDVPSGGDSFTHKHSYRLLETEAVGWLAGCLFMLLKLFSLCPSWLHWGSHWCGLGCPELVSWLFWCNQVPHTFRIWQFCSWVGLVKCLVFHVAFVPFFWQAYGLFYKAFLYFLP